MRVRVLLFCGFMLARTAFAEPNDPAVARELFEEARGLMAKGDYAEAEKRLEAALSHSNGRGIKYQLAVCHEKLGHVARAWILYVDVAESSRVAGENDRERVARAHAAELTPRVPYVRLSVSDEGVTVRRDDEPVASWDAPLAIDPGKHLLHVEAPGYRPWATTVEAREGETVEVRVPPLERVVAETVATPPPPLPLVFTPPRVEHVASYRSPVRTIGITASAAGLVALGVGGGFVIASAATYASASSMCDLANHCSPQGAAIRGDGLTYGDVATALVIGGAVAVVAGVVTWVVAPRRAAKLAFEPVLRF